MKTLIQLPGILLPASLFALVVYNGNSVMDIHIHDTLFVLPARYYFTPVYSIVFLSWLFHVQLRIINLLSLSRAWWQVILTVLPVLLYCIQSLFRLTIDGQPRRYYTYSAWETFQHTRYMVLAFALSILIAALAQIIFWIYGTIKLFNSMKQ